LAHILMVFKNNKREEAERMTNYFSSAAELKQSTDQVKVLQEEVTKLKQELELTVPKVHYQKTEVRRATAEAEILQIQKAHDSVSKAYSQLHEANEALSKEHSMIKTLYIELVGKLDIPSALSERESILTPRCHRAMSVTLTPDTNSGA